MDAQLSELVWRGIIDSNPWWSTGKVPVQRTAPFRRHAFDAVYKALRSSERGRGLVVLGPRRVGKSVLVHQVIEKLLGEGVSPQEICFLALDDVALRNQDLGELLTLLEARQPIGPDRLRLLLLDEVQHSKDWSGWLKRLADRRDPYAFLATGSSASALAQGGQDKGFGRWMEMSLFPWSFREHVELRGIATWHTELFDRLWKGEGTLEAVVQRLGPPGPGDAEALDAALTDYFLRGGFPEAALSDDLSEVRRRLRQDILDRALGRDITDVADVDGRLLERLFLRICMAPGGAWNEAGVARDLQVSRPTVSRYLDLLERAFLVFRLPNLASPVKGQPKVYLVAPSLRQALLALDEGTVGRPDEWGRLVENAVAATVVGTRPTARQVGFWRKGPYECDVVVVETDKAEYIEVKRSGKKAVGGILRAATDLAVKGKGWILERNWNLERLRAADAMEISRIPASLWLYLQVANAGGTLRIAT